MSPTKTPIGPGRRVEHRINKAYQMAFGIRLENMERKIDEIFYLVHPDCPNRLKPKWPMPNPPKPVEQTTSDQPSSIPATAATATAPVLRCTIRAPSRMSRGQGMARQYDRSVGNEARQHTAIFNKECFCNGMSQCRQ